VTIVYHHKLAATDPASDLFATTKSDYTKIRSAPTFDLGPDTTGRATPCKGLLPMPLSCPLADEPADATVSAPELLSDSFRPYERYQVELTAADGATLPQRREILRVGRVIGVLALDPSRAEVVLIRQFRLAAQLSTGRGELVEIVAGHVEPGEAPVAAARRECLEEIGVVPRSLHELFSFMPAPGMLEEFATLYLALVDAAAVPLSAGAAHENELTRPMRVAVDDALAALADNKAQNGYLILALQWLALNWPHMDEFLRTRTPAWP
jgi:ADP-ribose pyrophosphatase